jgi:hypothetical protein
VPGDPGNVMAEIPFRVEADNDILAMFEIMT